LDTLFKLLREGIQPQNILASLKDLYKAGTLLITDERCLDHAAFDKYHNVAKRQQQKDE
jgi:hypothetical protein